MPLSEFSLIRRYFFPPNFPAGKDAGILLGNGDDAAVLEPPEGQQLVLSSDNFSEGVHFHTHTDPAAVGHRSLAAALSDLAAMGARPWCFSLALTLPQADAAWLAPFSAGLAEAARRYQVFLVGGDTTRGPLSIGIHACGLAPPGQALRRSGARPGDALFLSGCIGDAAAGLALAAAPEPPAGRHQSYLLERHLRPEPRLAHGYMLQGLASAAIDLSDGLLADLSHLLEASGAGAEVRLAHIPLSAALRACCGERQALAHALGGGDDYELCFTVPPPQESSLWRRSAQQGLPCHRIGSITSTPGMRGRDEQGRLHPLAATGYRHF